MGSIMKEYPIEEFTLIVKTSSSMKECLERMGYKGLSGATCNNLRDYINELEIDISHFCLGGKTPVKRTFDNVFCKDATCSQATLRSHYEIGNYTIYKCAICEQLPIWNNKSLTLILDHIDGQNKNNELENLRWICPNCNMQLDTTGARNIKKEKIQKKYFCIDCEKEISAQSIRCVECSHKLQMRCERPSREELKQLIRTTPFVTIGKQYNVSDNAIRKWCDSYKLPRKPSDIKKISDIEWEEV